MKVALHIWRQKDRKTPGGFVRHQVDDASPDMSFLELLDVVNERLLDSGQDPIAFEHDCREGICGACGLVINGVPHGDQKATTTCQIHMRTFRDGDEIWVEPWRAAAFPILRDLVVDRGALDRVIQAGGFISARTGSAPDGNAILVPKPNADRSMDAASCIGCGACVASCPNGSASLFTAAKIAHLGYLPQGSPERYDRARAMVARMDEEGFGSCTNHKECEAVCPKDIPVDFIARMNRDFLVSAVTAR